MIVSIAVVAGILGEDVKYLVLPGREIVAENHAGAFAASVYGYNFAYGVDRIDAHYVGVAALILLALALIRAVAGARRGRSTA